MALVEREPEECVLESIRNAYLTREMRKTPECIEDMACNGLYEADVEKVFMDAEAFVNDRMTVAINREESNLAQYVIYGKSTKGAQVCCRFVSRHHPKTNDFIHWVMTSFEQTGLSI